MNIELLTKLPLNVRQELSQILQQFETNTPLRLAHFLAQCHHESGGFKSTTENMNYTSKRLLQVFPRYFTQQKAEKYARHPEMIGSRVYANRLGNGDESSKDGYRYRGRGFIQVTGKNKYVILDKLLPEDILNNPDLIATKYPLFSAAWFWDSVKLNQIADKGASLEICEEITKKVNGGKLGLLSRYKHFVNYYELLTIGEQHNGQTTKMD